LLGVGRFEMVVGPVTKIEAELAQGVLKVKFKVACGLGREGLLVEGEEDLQKLEFPTKSGH
jgi:hypothetical protein